MGRFSPNEVRSASGSTRLMLTPRLIASQLRNVKYFEVKHVQLPRQLDFTMDYSNLTYTLSYVYPMLE